MAAASGNSDIIIAMDCFRGNESNSLMIKKLAIGNANTEGLESFLFLPQIPWNELNEAAKKANNFSTRYIHNIRYDSGYIPYSELHRILIERTEGAEVIFTKGSQNAKFLAEALGRPVVDIDELGISRNQIRRIKKHIEPNRCLEDHTRKHSTPGFDGPNYAFCIERASLWTYVVQSYRDNDLAIVCPDCGGEGEPVEMEWETSGGGEDEVDTQPLEMDVVAGEEMEWE